MKTIIKIISTIFLFSAISTSAFAIDKLHFVVPGVVLEEDGMDAQEVLVKH
jgi:hypothetical protein